MVKENSILIRIDALDKLKQFAEAVTKFESNIDIHYNSLIYDAKSIISVYALVSSEPRYIEINPISKSEHRIFMESMRRFEANND